MSDSTLSRRVFLTRAGGLVLTLGTAPLAGPAWAALRIDPYRRGGLWLSGDHHVHTCFSIDGMYRIEEQVENAARSGLDFCVITDHGGPEHSRVLLSEAYPQLVAARRRFPQITVFQGLEWNIPAAEHGSIIVPPSEDEAQLIRDFQVQYDARASRAAATPPAIAPAASAAAPGPPAVVPPAPTGAAASAAATAGSQPAAPGPTPADSEAAAVAGVRYLQQRSPHSLFFANHPARRGLDSPHELRAWAEAGPDVMRGFEGAPGHGAAPLVGIPRGYYGETPGPRAHPSYPLHAYRTWGGYDYYVAQVGGLWDSLLGEGRAFYITANSDSHRYLGDRRETDRAAFRKLGYVPLTGRIKPASKGDPHDPDEDYPPGVYARTYVYAQSRKPTDVLDGMRGGNMWTVLGGLVDGVELWAHDGRSAAPMGSTLLVDPGAEVEIVLRIRPASRPNLAGERPVLHHIDLILGEILGPAPHRDTLHHPTARVVQTWRATEARRVDGWLELRHRLRSLRDSVFLRVRGTNTEVVAPRLDPLQIDPWRDLWFYSNPVMVRVRPA
jgi:hypothetical protein